MKTCDNQLLRLARTFPMWRASPRPLPRGNGIVSAVNSVFSRVWFGSFIDELVIELSVPWRGLLEGWFDIAHFSLIRVDLLRQSHWRQRRFEGEHAKEAKRLPLNWAGSARPFWRFEQAALWLYVKP
ncbi:hypothetical protein RC74_10115 [Falsihalocynthiibacter arcticus]|uniref:Uncharacterized protein n=1 Tax=Falsihalocynthiibacter arcticus TaxID=1579316 RepID=A0A126UZV5_9RHOB|nr:hypothetical protein RC74_10115 [Falsihalocynthiibacter arcticus]